MIQNYARPLGAASETGERPAKPENGQQGQRTRGGIVNWMTEISRYRAAFDTNPLFLNFGSYGPPSRTVVETGARLLDLTSSGTSKPQPLLSPG